MKIRTTYLLFIFIPTMMSAQWNQIGSELNGIVSGDRIGSNHSIDIDSTGNTIAFGTGFNSDVFPYSGYAKVFDWNETAWVQRGSTFFGTDSTLEGTGSAVSLSADGLSLAVSKPLGV